MAEAAGEHPRLVFGRSDVPRLREKARTPPGRAIVARLRKLLKRPGYDLNAHEAGFHAAGHALLYVLDGEPAHAETARQIVEMVFQDRVLDQGSGGVPLWNTGYKMIMRTDPAVGVALAYDLCCDAWEAGFRERIARELDAKARELIRGGGQGWNPSANSNWHANTRSGAGICALAVGGDPGQAHAEQSLREARRGVLDYWAGQVGDRGWTQESLAYLRYPTTHHLLPFVRMYRRLVDPRAFAGTPADWYALFYVHLLIPCSRHLPLVNVGRPRRFDQGFWHAGEFALGMGTVPERAKPALLWLYEQRHGLRGDRTFGVFQPHHAIFALADYPLDAAPANPATVLEKVWPDHKRGLYLFRDRWRGRDDFVTCLDVNVAPRRGTGRPDCTGSFAVAGLGHLWTFGTNNRVQVPGMDGRAGGERTFFHAEGDGSGVVSADLSGVYGAAGFRSFAVDYSGVCGSPALIAVADRVEAGGRKTWRMQGRGQATAEGNRFTVRGPGGATLSGVFLAPADVRISLPGRKARGGPAARPGRSGYTLRATGSKGQGGSFFVVMTIQRGEAPRLRAVGKGLDAEAVVGSRRVAFDGERIVLAARQERASSARVP